MVPFHFPVYRSIPYSSLVIKEILFSIASSQEVDKKETSKELSG